MVFRGCGIPKYQLPNISAFSPSRHMVGLHLATLLEGEHDHMICFSQFHVSRNYVISSKRYTHPNVHCGTIYNSRDMGAT